MKRTSSKGSREGATSPLQEPMLTGVEDGGRTPSISSAGGGGGSIAATAELNGTGRRFQDPPIATRSVWTSWLVQYVTLGRKTLSLLGHRKAFTAVLLLFPSLFVVLLWWLQQGIIATANLPVPLSVTGCKVFNVHGQVDPDLSRDCIPVAYAPATHQTNLVMQKMAAATGLVYGTDIVAFKDAISMAAYMFDHMGLVDTGVNFQTTNFSMPELAYDLWLNQTSEPYYAAAGFPSTYDHGFAHSRFLGVMNAVDSAMTAVAVEQHTGYHNITSKVGASISSYTSVNGNNLFNQAAQNVLLLAGPAMIVCGVTVAALMVLNLVTSEKYERLLAALRSVGVWDSAHWWSWFTVASILMIFMAVLAEAVGHATGLTMFSQVDVGIHFLSLYLFGCAFTAQMLWLGSFISRPRWVNTASFLVFAISIIGAFMFTSFEMFDAIYSPSITVIVKLLLWPMPWFHYGKVLYDILMYIVPQTSGSHITVSKYTWSVLGDELGPLTTRVNGFTTSYSVVSPGFNLAMLVVLVVFYLTLAWYFGQVFAGDLGASQRFYFPFDSAYWGFSKNRVEIIQGDTLAEEQTKSLEEHSVRIHKLSKSYDQTTALKEVTMQMSNGQLCAVLGHNGAGKTTMVSVLAGQLGPTHGEAYIFGKSIRYDLAELRTVMGCCPQHDVLWLDLTARQHLRCYAALKGVRQSEIDNHVEERLRSVNLEDEADIPVREFSGGMKRRLSVAIASMGSPRVIFLDEPTTGMDPLSRRRVWSLIDDLKRNRVVVLTTHSMEEADALGDTIAIMAQGRLRASGTSLFLKNRFGAGYQINIISSPDRVEDLKGIITSKLPAADIIGDSAGNLTIGLPRHATAQVPEFLRHLNRLGQDMVKEWGLSNSTLEEVFLRLASQTRDVNATAPDFNANSSGLCVLCQENPAVDVVLYTAKNVSVLAPNVICGRCADADPSLFENGRFVGPKVAAVVPVFEAGEFKVDSVGEASLVAQNVSPVYSPPVSDASPVEKRPTVVPMDVVLPPEAATKPLASVPVYQQAGSVFMQRAQLQLKQRRTNACQIVLLILVVLLTYFMTPSSKARNLCPQGWLENPTAAGNDDDDHSGGVAPQYSLCNRTAFIENMVIGKGFYDLWSWQNRYTPPYGTLYSYNWQQIRTVWFGGNWWQNAQVGGEIWYQDATGEDDVPLRQFDLMALGRGNNNITETMRFVAKPSTMSIPNTVQQAQQYIYDNGVSVSGQCSDMEWSNWLMLKDGYQAYYWFRERFPDMSIKMTRSQPFAKGSDSSIGLDYVYSIYSPDHYYQYARVAFQQNATATGSNNGCGQVYANSEDDAWQDLAIFVSSMNTALLRTALGPGPDNERRINARLGVMPEYRYPASVPESALGVQAFFFPLFTMFVMPTFVSVLVMEKDSKLFQMMRIEGMHTTAYWLGLYVFDWLYFAIYAAIYVVFGYLFSIPTVVHASPFMFFVVLTVWGHAQVGVTTLLGAVIPRERLATVLSYLIILVVAVTSVVFQALKVAWPSALMWLPPMSYSFSILTLLAHGGTSFVSGSPLQTATLQTLLTGTICLVLGMYLHAVLPSPSGPYMPPLLCLRASCRRRAGAATERIPLLANEVENDVDVVAERARVLAGSDANRAVDIRHLEKVFGVGSAHPKVAVHDLCMGINYGECFGLLGPNGAGKTTLLSILSGSLSSTSGLALVGGYDTNTQMDLVYRILGVCPQFDTVWEDLTVREHLMFYARMKGVPRRLAVAEVQRTAEKVNLDGDSFNMRAGALSGGMKRRLSLGIALIGNPRIVFMDEPTTGLDPETRRQIWAIIEREKVAGRSMVITTHSMEEADTLCSRIAIMAAGQLRCIGTQLHLKNRFGDGYKLSVSLVEESAAAYAHTDAFMRQHVSSRAQRISAIGLSVAYLLPHGIDVAALFQVLETHKTAAGITEWGLAQTSLEEVFIKIVKRVEERQDRRSHA